MRYSFVSAAILALASSVFAVDPTANFDPISVPTQDQNVAAGSTLDITWQPSTVHTGPITIALLQGASPSTLETGETIASSIDQSTGKYSWTVPKDLKSFATYGFSITLDSSTADPNTVIFQYSFPFHITGLSGSSSSSSAVGGTTTVHLSTGTGYTASATSTSSSANITSTYVPSSTKSAKPTTYAAASTSAYSSGNVTLYTTLTPTASSTSGSASSTSSAPAIASGNAATSNFAQGGLAMVGGLLLALAL